MALKFHGRKALRKKYLKGPLGGPQRMKKRQADTCPETSPCSAALWRPQQPGRSLSHHSPAPGWAPLCPPLENDIFYPGLLLEQLSAGEKPGHPTTQACSCLPRNKSGRFCPHGDECPPAAWGGKAARWWQETQALTDRGSSPCLNQSFRLTPRSSVHPPSPLTSGSESAPLRS